MTSIGITVHYNPLAREDLKEQRIVEAIKKICDMENVYCGIGYDEQIAYCGCKKPIHKKGNLCATCGYKLPDKALRIMMEEATKCSEIHNP